MEGGGGEREVVDGEGVDRTRVVMAGREWCGYSGRVRLTSIHPVMYFTTTLCFRYWVKKYIY